MDIKKLQLIKEDILKYPLPSLKYDNSFCGLYVDGTGKLTFEAANASIHAFKVLSQYDYSLYLFVAAQNDRNEIDKILKKYPNTKVYSIPPLKTSFIYNEWMMNYPWFLIDPKHPRVFTFQEDGGLISKGWEDYFIKGDWDYIGSPWRADIEVLTHKCYTLKTLRVANGGVSCRKIKSMIKAVQFLNKEGGQHKFFKGIKINGELKQENSWLAEDSMLCSIGFTFDIFKPLKEEDARRFGHEPIELSMYMDKNNIDRPYIFHKIDN